MQILERKVINKMMLISFNEKSGKIICRKGKMYYLCTCKPLKEESTTNYY